MAKPLFSVYSEKCKGCGLCIEFCGRRAIIMEKTFNSKGYHFVSIGNECNGCGICFTVCPDWAINTDEKKALER